MQFVTFVPIVPFVPERGKNKGYVSEALKTFLASTLKDFQ